MKDYSKPAFPSRSGMMFYVPGEHKEAVQHTIEAMDREHEGMTLRDYFAAKAMQSLVVAIYTPGMKMTGKNGTPLTESTIAEQAYHFADAMLTERAA